MTTQRIYSPLKVLGKGNVMLMPIKHERKQGRKRRDWKAKKAKERKRRGRRRESSIRL